MNDKPNKLGDLLADQESVNLQRQTDYKQRILAMMERRVHWIFRVLCGILALVGGAFCVSFVFELIQTQRGNSGVAFIVKFSLILLLVCVLFYTVLIARVAVRGRIRPGWTPATILGASVMAGFFACLWLFLIFILPKLVQIITTKPDNPPTDKAVEFFVANIWIGTSLMLLMIAFFGVLTAGISILIHLQHSHFSSQRQKLLEIELAVAELSEKAG